MKQKEGWINTITGFEEGDLLTEQEIDYRIKLHKNEIANCENEIKYSKESIEVLQEMKRTVKYGFNNVIFAVADALHEHKCMSCYAEPTHCTYRMTTWDDYNSGKAGTSSRLLYVGMAEDFIKASKDKGVNLRDALSLLDVLN